MKKAKTNTLILILIAVIILSIPIVTLAADPPAPVTKTGQTKCYADNGTFITCSDTGQDGDLQKGVASPSPRFTDNGDGTVTDNLTGLMWAKDANMAGTMTWANALDYANNLSMGGDGCEYDPVCDQPACGQPACEQENCREDWRLPNRFELESLLDLSNYDPALPTGHPFTNVQWGNTYWSSTTHAHYIDSAWNAGLANGYCSNNYKTGWGFLLPVRGPDSDADCITGTTQPCGSDVGECQSGIQTCIIGQWGSCTGEIGPITEVCDGIDNNCNAEVDEIEQSCENQVGVCSGSTKTCVNGEWPICDQNNFPPGYEPVETSCSDDKDNDCDGQTDIGDSDCS
jgi:hypothetical protein